MKSFWKNLEIHFKVIAGIISVAVFISTATAAYVTRIKDLETIEAKYQVHDRKLDKLVNALEEEHDETDGIRNTVTRIENDVSWIKANLQKLTK